MASGHPPGTTTDPILETVDALHRSVLDRRSQYRVPRLLGRLVDSDLTSFWCFSTDYQYTYGNDFGDRSRFREYMTHWAGRDDVIHEALTSYRGTTVDMDTVLAGKPSLRAAPVFEGYYGPRDLVNAAGHFRAVAPGWVGGVAVLRGHRRGRFTPAEQACLRRLAPHIQRALALSLHLDTQGLRCAAAERLLADSGLTMIACTPGGRVLDHTYRAEHALRGGAHGLGLRHGRLEAHDGDSEAELRAALRNAGRGRLPPTELRLTGRGGRHTWCTVLPLPQGGESAAGEPHDCLIVLHVPGDRDLLDADRVTRSLAVSPAEGDVLAGLMRGEDIVAIARRRGVTTETIRSYEKALRMKLDCHSRAALVARGWSTLATIPAVPEPSGQHA